MARTEESVDQAVAVLNGVGKRQTVAPITVDEVMAAWAELDGDEDAILKVTRSLPTVVRALRHARAAERAEELARAALPSMVAGEARALVALEQNTAQLHQGHDADDLVGAVREALRFSDERVALADFERAATIVVHVNEALFHRELHGEVEESPLAYDTEAFLAPLRESFTYQTLVAPSGAMADRIDPQEVPPAAPAAAAVPARPSGVKSLVKRLLGRSTPSAAPSAEAESAGGPKVLALTAGNLHFASGMLDDLRENGADVRVRQIRDAKYPRRGHPDMIADRLADAAGHQLAPLPKSVAADLEWADIVFVDWFDVAAQWATIHVPRGTRLVVRVHSLEAISAQPHLVDHSKVSDLIFVGAHVRDLFLQAVPAASATERIHVIPNEMRLERFGLPKTQAAERTIALIGWAQQVKAPLWALDLLGRLRAADPSWRLLLVGKDFNESLTPSGYAYRDRFRARREEADVREGLVELGYRTDLPEVMREAGYILSCSNREGGPVGLTEGAASAAVPIVRDWPMAQPFGGARRIFPDDWVVANVDEAVKRVLTLEGDARAKAGEEARAHALATFDWSVVAPKYREIFLGS